MCQLAAALRFFQCQLLRRPHTVTKFKNTRAPFTSKQKGPNDSFDGISQWRMLIEHITWLILFTGSQFFNHFEDHYTIACQNQGSAFRERRTLFVIGSRCLGTLRIRKTNCQKIGKARLAELYGSTSKFALWTNSGLVEVACNSTGRLSALQTSL